MSDAAKCLPMNNQFKHATPPGPLHGTSSHKRCTAARHTDALQHHRSGPREPLHGPNSAWPGDWRPRERTAVLACGTPQAAQRPSLRTANPLPEDDDRRQTTAPKTRGTGGLSPHEARRSPATPG